jgi:hypothetical protein
VRVQQKAMQPAAVDSGFDLKAWEEADFKLLWVYPRQVVVKTAVRELTDVRDPSTHRPLRHLPSRATRAAPLAV